MAIYQKRISVGSFLKKGEDIKDGDIVTIGSEGKQVEGQFGLQDLFLVKTALGKEGNVSFNLTSINALVDAYGEESKNWIGKKAKVWAILSNVQGKMTKVYYYTHPDAEINDEGGFTIKHTTTNQNTPVTPKSSLTQPLGEDPRQETPDQEKTSETIDPKDLPF